MAKQKLVKAGMWLSVTVLIIAIDANLHFIGFNNLNKKKETKLKNFLFKHQIKKKFQYSLEWEKNQLAIWDNRSMLHQATPFRGDRIMHRITIY